MMIMKRLPATLRHTLDYLCDDLPARTGTLTNDEASSIFGQVQHSSDEVLDCSEGGGDDIVDELEQAIEGVDEMGGHVEVCC